MNLHLQSITLASMIFSGIMMGILYDSYQVLFHKFPFARWKLHGLDLLYWVICMLFVFRVLYSSNYGNVRFYVLLGLCVGALIYYFFLSKTTQRLLLSLIRAGCLLTSFFHKLCHLFVFKPIKTIFNFLFILLNLGSSTAILFLKLVIQFIVPLIRIMQFFIRPLHLPWKKSIYWFTCLYKEIIAVLHRFF